MSFLSSNWRFDGAVRCRFLKSARRVQGEKIDRVFEFPLFPSPALDEAENCEQNSSS
jgi:hypothetical protein